MTSGKIFLHHFLCFLLRILSFNVIQTGVPASLRTESNIQIIQVHTFTLAIALDEPIDGHYTFTSDVTDK